MQSKSPTKLNKNALTILEMAYISRETTIPEMAKKIGVTERAIEKNIQKLKEAKLLERMEGRKDGIGK